jgi:hypothetical protein
MSNEPEAYLQEALEYWRKDEPIKAGRLIFERLPREIQPKWAAEILKAVVGRSGATSPEIERIIEMARNPAEWSKGHDAFSAARTQVLKLDRMSSKSSADNLLHHNLLLAELVAKVTYNATYPNDGFDEDSGWWVAVLLRDILRLLADTTFSELMWSKLCLRNIGEY